MHLFFDLDYITEEVFHKIYEPQFLIKQSYARSFTDSNFLIVDSDDGIVRNRFKKYPIIAWQHEKNNGESLMDTPWLILSPDSLDEEYLEEIYARYYKKPLRILETKRCIVRELTNEDLPPLLTLQSEETKDGNFFPENVSKDSRKDFLKNYIDTQYPFFGFGIYAILKKTDHTFLGIAGFSETEVADVANISYAILPNYRNLGYATEVVSALLPLATSRFGFSNVLAIINKKNTTSLNLAKRCGITTIQS